MKKIIVCQHVAFEILGTLNPMLKSAGFRIRYVNFGRQPAARPSLDGYDGLVVLGGPMNVDDVGTYPHLETEVGLIGEALRREMPVLGICLGAQLIAKALGASVEANGEKEIGWYPLSITAEGTDDPFLGSFGESEHIFQWHGDTFDIPEGAVHLASSPDCRNQAFRYGTNVYGLQFHLEVDERLIKRWLEVPIHLEELAQLEGRIDPERIREETPQYIGRTKELAERSFGGFIEILGRPSRAQVLSSI